MVCTWRICCCLPVKVSLSALDPCTETMVKRAAQMSSLCGISHNGSKSSWQELNTILEITLKWNKKILWNWDKNIDHFVNMNIHS